MHGRVINFLYTITQPLGQMAFTTNGTFWWTIPADAFAPGVVAAFPVSIKRGAYWNAYLYFLGSITFGDWASGLASFHSAKGSWGPYPGGFTVFYDLTF